VDIGVKINGTDLIQILLNLSVNAFQCATQPHRVEVGGETLHAPLKLAEFKDGLNDRLLNVESMHNTAPLVKLWAVSYTHLDVYKRQLEGRRPAIEGQH